MFELIIVNWNPFQTWFSEVAPFSWHTNFISRSYGRGIRARFVIFGSSLPYLTILYIKRKYYISRKFYFFKRKYYDNKVLNIENESLINTTK